MIGRIRFGYVCHPLRFDQIARACQQLHNSYYDLVAQGVQLFGGGGTYRLEDRTLVGDAIDPIEKQSVNANRIVLTLMNPWLVSTFHRVDVSALARESSDTV